MVEVAGKKLSPGEITIMAAGAVALIFSFFDFYGGPDLPEVDLGGRTVGGSLGASVWSSGLLPVATLMVLFCVAMAVQVALAKFTSVHMPDRVIGFTWTQVHLVLGFFAALYAVAYLLVETGGFDKKIGFWMIFLACIAALVGAILLRNEHENAPPPTPPASPPAA